MADVNANIGVGIDTSDALGQLKNLQRQISQFHQSVAKSSATAAAAQRDLQKNFLNSVNAIQGFSAELRTVRTTAESFTNSLEKNKFSIKEYFRYAAGATKTFGKSFKAEFDTIEKTAIERVKTLQTQFIKVGRDANGAMQAIKIRPTTLDMTDLGTQIAIAGQKQALFNQLLHQGSTNLLNFGKNTQWAGRQLMVGFTLPLATLGVKAGQTFMEMEKAVLKFRKVYGDLFTTQSQVEEALQGIKDLAMGYTKYGIAIKDTVGLAAEAAAAGYQGVDLQNQTNAATKLSILGQIEQQQALETTIALQNAFKISSAELAENIDFLNAVENQTVVSLDDITTAIPKVAPVIQQLGGSVKDLAFFMAAFEEGGINASEGANALKSGLAALINPTAKASEMLAAYGINIRGIVDANQGNLAGTVTAFAAALDKLAPTDRARAIEQLFGKFQFARLSTLFQNVAKDGTQASRVLELAGSSVSDLAALTDKELGQTAESTMNKFTGAVERLNATLAPVGEQFLKIATPFVEFATNVLDGFNKLPDGIKSAITTTIGVVGGLAPVFIMIFGLLANGLANAIKFFAIMRQGFLKITGQAVAAGEATQYMTTEQLEAAAAAASLEQSHSKLEQQFTAEAGAVMLLKAAYEQALAAGNRFALMNPGQMNAGGKVAGFAKGGVIQGPGTGTSDSIAAMVSTGEAIIPAAMAKKYAPLIQGIIAGNIPGFVEGDDAVGLPSVTKLAKQFGEKGAAPANASHLEMFSPRTLADTLKRLSEIDEAFGNVEVQLTKFVPRVDDLGNQVEIDGKKIYDSVVTLQKIKDLSLEDLDAFVTGKAFGGTAVNESRDRNIGAYQAADIGGASFTLTEVQEAGAKAARALESGAVVSDSVRAELEKLVAEGRRATELLASENSVTADFTYSKEIATKGIREALLKDTSNEHDATTALTEAKRRVAETEQKFATNIANGMDEQEALRLAQAELAAKLFLSSKREDQDAITMVAGEQGAGRSLLRPAAALGPKSVKSKSPRQIGNVDETPGVQRGRDAATVEAMMIKEAQQYDAVGFDFATAVSDTFYGGVNRGLGINSPSKEFADISDAVSEGVRQTKPEAEKAGQEIGKAVSAGSSFGNIGAQEPVAATGNAPRDVVTTMAAESQATKTLAGDIQASFANARANIARESAWLKEEFNSIIQSIKSAFGRGGREVVANVEATNNQMIINGKAAGFNYIAEYQGRDGAIEAILTKKNAEIIAKLTQEWNSGVRVIPKIVADGMKPAFPEFEMMGERIADTLAKGMIKRAGNLKAADTSVAGGMMYSKPAGPEEDPAARAKRMADATDKQLKKVQDFSSKLSGAALGLSAISGVMSMFGGQMGEFSGVIMGLTSGLFALMQVTALLTQAQGARVVAEQVASAGGLGQLFSSFKGVATGAAGLGKGLSGLWGVVSGAFPIASKLIPVLGGVLLAFQAFQFITGIIKEQQERMRGFSAATNMATDKLVSLSKAAGNQNIIKPLEFTGDTANINTNSVTVEKQTKAEKTVEAAGGQEEFNKTYEKEINALKNTKGDKLKSTAALTNLAVNLSLAGNDTDQVEGIVTALQKSAELTDIELDFKSLSVYNADGTVNTDAVTQAATATATAYKATYDAELKKWKDAGGDKPMELPTGGIAFGTAGMNVNSVAEMERITAGQREAVAIATENVGGPEAAKTDSVIQGMNYELQLMEGTLAAYNGTFRETGEIQKAATEAIASTAGQVKLVGAGFQQGTMTVDQFNTAMDSSLDPMLTIGNATDNINGLFKEMGVAVPKDLGNQLKDPADKAKLLKAAVAGVDLNKFAKDNKGIKDKATVLKNLATATTNAAVKTQELNAANSYENAVAPLKASIAAVQAQLDTVDAVVKAGGDKAIAYQIAGDAALSAAMNEALAADIAAKAAGNTANNVANFLADVKKLNSLSKKFQAGSAAASGSQKDNPFDAAVKSLKEAKAGIYNVSAAYQNLKKKGYDVATAMKLATDPTLTQAMAEGIKVGSKEWNTILKKIKEVQAAEEKWKNSSLTGRTEQFNETYDKVESIFSAEEAQLQEAFDEKTKADKDLVASLEKDIETKNRSIGSYEDQLDAIAEKEDAINKSYDEKAKALETVKKLNQDIINQQKAQMSIADALASGDVSAAARLIQESRGAQAAAAGDTQAEALAAGKDAQLANVKGANGLTREENEAKIKDLKKQIHDIEIGELRTARDRITAAEEQLVKDTANLRVSGLTRKEWSDMKTDIDAATARGSLYQKEVDKALKNVEGIKKGWEAINGKVYVTTHEIKTVLTGAASGSSSSSASGAKKLTTAPAALSFLPTAARNAMGYLASGGMVPKYFGTGGEARGTDTVPAMLTPGEFVMNKSATDKFRPLLSSINSGKLGKSYGASVAGSAPEMPHAYRNYVQAYAPRSFNQQLPEAVYDYAPKTFNQEIPSVPSVKYSPTGGSMPVYQDKSSDQAPANTDNSVYNYNLSINVEGSNSSPDQIASVVMNKLRGIKAQGIRGQVVR